MDFMMEEKLLEIVKNHTKADYQRVISEKREWYFLYHLSGIRSNILEWYPFEPHARVLEIGAECGAITGCMADKVAHVTCQVDTEQQSKIHACRYKDKKNIEVILGSYGEIESRLGTEYDYVTMIGICKYAPYIYKNSKKPYVEMVENALSHLKQGGTLLLAVENRLGMKYWAGCQDDYYSKYFWGIQNYPGVNENGVRTFSKREWERILHEAGASGYKFYYPYPDHQFPMAIYSDEYLPGKGELNMNMRSFDRGRFVLFDETRAFTSIVSEGLFPEFSNSYLISITKGAK